MALYSDEYSLTTMTMYNNGYAAYVLPTPTTIQASDDDYFYIGTLVYTDASAIYLLDPCISRVTKPTACSTYIGIAYGSMSAEAVPELAFTSELASQGTLDDLLSPAAPAMTSMSNSDTPSHPSFQTTSSQLPTATRTSDVSQEVSATSDLAYIHSSITLFAATPTPTHTPKDTSTRTAIITIPTVICATILIGIASFFYKRRKRFAGSSYSPPAFQTTIPVHHCLEFDSQEVLGGGKANGKGMVTSNNETFSTHNHTPQRHNSIFFARPVSYNHIINQQDHQQAHHHELQETPTHTTGDITAESEIGCAISPPGYEYHRHLTTSIAPNTQDNTRRVASEVIDQELGLLPHQHRRGFQHQHHHKHSSLNRGSVG